jgi:poly-gamma-glutamate capsule biosynthesis protein CapA/YwtB (metallophosphatase superfamily)
MNPDNAPVIAAAGLDACVLANNHVLDWGESGLRETLETLARIGARSVGAGRNREEAAAPAMVPVAGGNIIVFAFGLPTSGVPRSWAATDKKPGVNFLPELTPRAVGDIAAAVQAAKRPGDIVVVSLHWGGNWGYEISPDQRAFARELIDEARVDVIWGHSSHHPKGIEVHNGKLVLYGCGDFLDDYEGIRGYEEFRDDLVLMYFPTIAMSDGALLEVSMAPLQIRNFRLNRVSRPDAEWLRDMLNREGSQFGTHVELGADNTLTLQWKRKASVG